MLVALALAAGALLSAVLAVALYREVRLRRALEALLYKILNTWRQPREFPDRGPREHNPGGLDDERGL